MLLWKGKAVYRLFILAPHASSLSSLPRRFVENFPKPGLGVMKRRRQRPHQPGTFTTPRARSRTEHVFRSADDVLCCIVQHGARVLYVG